MSSSSKSILMFKRSINTLNFPLKDISCCRKLQSQVLTRHLHSYSSNNINVQLLRKFNFNTNLVRYFSEPEISKGSWAKPILEKQGEKLKEQPESERDKILIITDDILENPSPKIKRLCIEILELNMVEVNSLMHVLMVSEFIDYC